MKKFRVRLTETTVYEEVVVEARNLYEAEQKHIQMLDKGQVEVAWLDDTNYRIDEV